MISDHRFLRIEGRKRIVPDDPVPIGTEGPFGAHPQQETAMNVDRPSRRIGRAIPFALVLALAVTSAASAQSTKKSTAKPNLIPASVTNVTNTTGVVLDDGVAKQRYRICAKNVGIVASGQPWRIIVSYPDDKGGRPNAYYWSPHDVKESVQGTKSYCYERDIWITACRQSAPRIRVAVDTNDIVAESREDDNREAFYPTSALDQGDIYCQ